MIQKHVLSVCLPFGLLICSLTPQIPAQVAQEETQLVQQYLEQQAAQTLKNIDKFTQLTQPYAPLDFQVRQASNEHASAIRNYLFGVASAVADLGPTVAPKMANDFHCGDRCATERIKNFVDQHEQVSALVMRFVPLSRIDIIAQWGVTGDLRVNDTFVTQGVITAFTPVGKIGIVPNSNGRTVKTLQEATGLADAEVAEAKEIAAVLASMHLVAIVRSEQGIRVIRTGNADNQCGLLFKRLSVKPPKQGDSFGEGLDVNGVTMLAKDIYYFETN